MSGNIARRPKSSARRRFPFIGLMLLVALAVLAAIVLPAVRPSADPDQPPTVPIAGGRLTQIGPNPTTLRTDSIEVGGASTVWAAIAFVDHGNLAHYRRVDVYLFVSYDRGKTWLCIRQVDSAQPETLSGQWFPILREPEDLASGTLLRAVFVLGAYSQPSTLMLVFSVQSVVVTTGLFPVKIGDTHSTETFAGGDDRYRAIRVPAIWPPKGTAERHR